MTGPQAAFTVCAITLGLLALGALVVMAYVGRPGTPTSTQIPAQDPHQHSGAAPAGPRNRATATEPLRQATAAPDAPVNLLVTGKSEEAAVPSTAAPESHPANQHGGQHGGSDSLWLSADPMRSCVPCMDGDHAGCLDLIVTPLYGMHACGCTNAQHEQGHDVPEVSEGVPSWH